MVQSSHHRLRLTKARVYIRSQATATAMIVMMMMPAMNRPRRSTSPSGGAGRRGALIMGVMKQARQEGDDELERLILLRCCRELRRSLSGAGQALQGWWLKMIKSPRATKVEVSDLRASSKVYYRQRLSCETSWPLGRCIRTSRTMLNVQPEIGCMGRIGDAVMRPCKNCRAVTRHN